MVKKNINQNDILNMELLNAPNPSYIFNKSPINRYKTKEKTKSTKELGLITKTLKLSKSLKSNKEISYRVLAQIASSVPNRVKFESVDYNGKSQVIIQGVAASDQDILRLIGNLSSKNLIQQASLTSMQLPNSSNKTGQASKGFKIFVKIKKG